MNAVARLVQELGGIRPACEKIERITGRKVWPNSVQHWIEVGRLPLGRRDEILKTAVAEGIQMSEDEANALVLGTAA